MAELQLTPALASDERFRVLCQLTAERFDAIDLVPLLIYLVDTVAASALPFLAETFHIEGEEGWSFAPDETSRRALLKRAIAVHRLRGTPAAVYQVLEALGYGAEVLPWYVWGGEPGTYRVEVYLSGPAAIWPGEQLVRLVRTAQGAGDHLDQLILAAQVDGALGIASFVTFFADYQVEPLPEVLPPVLAELGIGVIVNFTLDYTVMPRERA